LFADHPPGISVSLQVEDKQFIGNGHLIGSSLRWTAYFFALICNRTGRAPAKTEHLEIIDVEYAPIPMDPFREPLGAQSTPKVEGS
jgi:hypothetical protein